MQFTKLGIPFFDLNSLEGDKSASVLIGNREGFVSESGIKILKTKQKKLNLVIVDEVQTY